MLCCEAHHRNQPWSRLLDEAAKPAETDILFSLRALPSVLLSVLLSVLPAHPPALRSVQRLCSRARYEPAHPAWAAESVPAPAQDRIQARYLRDPFPVLPLLPAFPPPAHSEPRGSPEPLRIGRNQRSPKDSNRKHRILKSQNPGLLHPLPRKSEHPPLQQTHGKSPHPDPHRPGR